MGISKISRVPMQMPSISTDIGIGATLALPLQNKPTIQYIMLKRAAETPITFSFLHTLILQILQFQKQPILLHCGGL